jgi:hypothetical protein
MKWWDESQRDLRWDSFDTQAKRSTDSNSFKKRLNNIFVAMLKHFQWIQLTQSVDCSDELNFSCLFAILKIYSPVNGPLSKTAPSWQRIREAGI